MQQATTFFYDLLSPYVYLAFTQLSRIEQVAGQEVERVPVDGAAVAKRAGNVFTNLTCPAKTRYVARTDLPRWARRYGVPFRFNERLGKFRSRPLALSALAAQRRGELEVFDRAVLHAFHVDGVDLGERRELARVLGAAGVADPEQLLREAQSGEHDAELDGNVARALKAGVFGVPTFVHEGELFFGNDRIDLLLEALSS